MCIRDSSKAARAAEQEKRRQSEAEEKARLEAERARVEAELVRLEAERKILEQKSKLEAERLKLEQEKQRLALEAERLKLEQEKARMAASKAPSETRPPTQAGEAPRVASLPPSRPLNRPGSRPLTMALLPWHFQELHLKWTGQSSARDISDLLADDLYEDRDVHLTHSFYPWDGAGRGGEVQAIPLSSKEAEAVWVKEGLFSKPNPDVKRVAVIGRRLGVDLVLMARAAGDDMGKGLLCEAFLIETATDRLIEFPLHHIRPQTFTRDFAKEIRKHVQGYLEGSEER